MNTHIRFFASVAQCAGVREARVTIDHGTTVGEFRSMLGKKYGEDFAKQLAISAIMINGVHAEDSQPLAAGEDGSIRADILPPFAGG